MADEVSTEPSGAELFTAAKKALTENNLQFDANEEYTFLTLPFSGTVIQHEVYLYIGHGYATAVAQLPLKVSPDRLHDVLQTLNQKTTEIPLGNFQVHEKKQLVQFKVGLVLDGMPSDRQIVLSVVTASKAIDAVAPTVMKMLA